MSDMSDSDDSISTIREHELLDDDLDPMDEDVGKGEGGDTGPGTPTLSGLSLDLPTMDWGAVPVPAESGAICPTAAGDGRPGKAEVVDSRPPGSDQGAVALPPPEVLGALGTPSSGDGMVGNTEVGDPRKRLGSPTWDSGARKKGPAYLSERYCPFPGCAVFPGNRKHARQHLPSCFNKSTMDERTARQRGEILSRVADLTSKGSLEELCRRVDRSGLIPFQAPLYLEAIEDCARVARVMGWRVDTNPSLSPLSGPMMLGHWRAMLAIMCRLSPSQRARVLGALGEWAQLPVSGEGRRREAPKDVAGAVPRQGVAGGPGLLARGASGRAESRSGPQGWDPGHGQFGGPVLIPAGSEGSRRDERGRAPGRSEARPGSLGDGSGSGVPGRSQSRPRLSGQFASRVAGPAGAAGGPALAAMDMGTQGRSRLLSVWVSGVGTRRWLTATIIMIGSREL